MDTLVLSVVSRNYFNIPVWIGRSLGYFEREGLDVDIEHIESIEAVNDRLRSGAAQLNYGVTEHVILDAEAGGQQTIIGGNVNKLPFSLIAHPSVTSIAELRGKRIGVSSLRAGSSSLVMNLLAQHGLHYPDDYTLIPCGPILARWEKLQAGEIDAGLQGAPMDQIARDAGYATLAGPADLARDFQFTSLNVNADWAAGHRDLLLRFLRAFIRSHERFHVDRAAANRIAEQEAGLSERYADRTWHDFVRDGILPIDGEANEAGIQAMIDTSGLIRDLPTRRLTSAAAYMDRSWLADARNSL